MLIVPVYSISIRNNSDLKKDLGNVCSSLLSIIYDQEGAKIIPVASPTTNSKGVNLSKVKARHSYL